MAESQPWNSLGYLEKCWMASKASLNASIEGYSLKDCAIDTMKISTFGEYLANKKRNEDPTNPAGWDDSLKDDKKLGQRYVVPVTLPNGREIDVIIDQKGRDEARVLVNMGEGEKEFDLTPRMKKAIQENTPENLDKVIGAEAYKANFLPDSIDGYAEKVKKDELVPKSKKHAAQIAGVGTGELEKQEQERENAEKEIPAEARDKIAKICSENGLDIADLKEVMEVRPETIENNLENTGIRENDGRVYCLRFRDGANIQGRVVMAQADKVVDDRRYDDYLNDYMNEHKGQKVVREKEDEHDKLVYTDLDGNTTVCEITREPRDLNCSEKELLQAEMEKLDNNAAYILNSDMPTEMKTQEIIKINGKRLDLFKSYGVEVPLVEDEIEADIEISEEVQDIAEEKAAEEENNTNDDRDPRESNSYDGGRLPPWLQV